MGKKRKISTIEASTMPHMHVTLYHDRDKLSRDLRSRGIEMDFSASGNAQTFTLDIDGTDIAFVLLDPCDWPLWEQLALLAHEATHVAVRYFEGIGEEEPGDEELAYAVQAAAGCLFDMHLEWLDKQKGKKHEEKQ